VIDQERKKPDYTGWDQCLMFSFSTKLGNWLRRMSLNLPIFVLVMLYYIILYYIILYYATSFNNSTHTYTHTTVLQLSGFCPGQPR